jgi:5,10-methylenetetrahydromethanopterin reductase
LGAQVWTEGARPFAERADKTRQQNPRGETSMEMSISLPTKARSFEVVKRAEELGYCAAWFYDTQLLNAEMFAAMGASAIVTSKIKLCTGVVIPSNRIAPVTASGLATINALAPGRVIFGASTGFTGRRTLGLPAVTLARLEAYVKVVEALLRGETVEWSEEDGPHKIRFLNPELGLINITDPIPTVISAFGPKARRLTAKLGAGWIAPNSWPEREKTDMTEYQAAWKEFGHGVKQPPRTAITMAGRVLDDGEPADSKLALAQAGPYVAIAFHNLVEEEQFGSIFRGGAHFPFPNELEAYRKVYQQYQPPDARYLTNHRGHLMFVRPEETHITADVIKVLSLTATRSECIERLRGIKQLGFDEVQFHTVPGHEEDMLRRWADVMEKV